MSCDVSVINCAVISTDFVCCILSELNETKVQLFGFPLSITEVRIFLLICVYVVCCHGDALEAI